MVLGDPASPEPVRLELTEEAAVVVVSGDADLALVPALQEALDEAIDRGPAVVVDLCACAFMDSTGLGQLLGAVKRCKERGLAMRVVCVPDSPPHALLGLVVPGVLSVFPGRDAAR